MISVLLFRHCSSHTWVPQSYSDSIVGMPHIVNVKDNLVIYSASQTNVLATAPIWCTSSEPVKLIHGSHGLPNVHIIHEDEARVEALPAERRAPSHVRKDPTHVPEALAPNTLSQEMAQGTHEETLFVVAASERSLRRMPVPRRLMSRKWLRRYMWSDVASDPLMRSIEHGKVSSVESYGGSHIWGAMREYA